MGQLNDPYKLSKPCSVKLTIPTRLYSHIVLLHSITGTAQQNFCMAAVCGPLSRLYPIDSILPGLTWNKYVKRSLLIETRQRLIMTLVIGFLSSQP
jgi:hypothetical protein